MGPNKVNIVCYKNDALLVADNDNLQRKNLVMVISRDPQRRKLEVDNKSIEQILTFTYLGIDITCDRNITATQKEQKR